VFFFCLRLCHCRSDRSIIINYGRLIVEMSAVVPDGMVVFFPSYRYMEEVVTAWANSKVLEQITTHKLLFIETQDVVETTLALENFKRACDVGRGAVFFSVILIPSPQHTREKVTMKEKPFVSFVQSLFLISSCTRLREERLLRVSTSTGTMGEP
jgi:hypothetical protein